MDETNLSKEDRQKLLGILSEIKDCAKELAECARPLFDGNRFLSDSELARRLRISRSTLSNYRIKGVLDIIPSVVKSYMPTARLRNTSRKTTIPHTDDTITHKPR